MNPIINIDELKVGDVIPVYVNDLSYPCIYSKSENKFIDKFEYGYYLNIIQQGEKLKDDNGELFMPKTLLRYEGNDKFTEYYSGEVINANYYVHNGENKKHCTIFNSKYGDESSLTPKTFMEAFKTLFDSPFYVTLVRPDKEEDEDRYLRINKDIIETMKHQIGIKDKIISIINNAKSAAQNGLECKLSEFIELDHTHALEYEEEQNIKKFIYNDENKKA